MREIKFRAWEPETKIIYTPTSIPNPTTSPDRTGGILMQYTGLKDKNGKEIYEGDIVVHPLYGIAEVKFGGGTNQGAGDSSGYFYGYYIEIKGRKDGWGDYEVDSGCFYDEPDKLEIIGNIYENPALVGH